MSSTQSSLSDHSGGGGGGIGEREGSEGGEGVEGGDAGISSCSYIMDNDTIGETTEMMMPPPPEPLEHGSKLQRLAQRREIGNDLPLSTGDEMKMRIDGRCIQGDDGDDPEEEILSISDAVDLAHACSAPAEFFDVNGLNNFNVFNTFNALGGGKHDPTSFLDTRHTPKVLTSSRSVNGDDGAVARNNVEGPINLFDSNANNHIPVANFQQRTQRRRKTCGNGLFRPMEQLESTFDTNRSAEIPSIRNHQACTSNNGDVRVPLRKWIEGESAKQNSTCQTAGHGGDENKRVLLLKTTVAYGMAQLLRKSRSLLPLSFHPVKTSSLHTQFNIDNFVVRTKKVSNDGQHSQSKMKGIKGVGMLSPKLSVNIVEPLFTTFSSDDNEDNMGRYLEAEFPSFPDADGTAVVFYHSEEDERCHLFGIILCELFSNCSPPAEAMRGNILHTNRGGPESALTNGDASQEPARKKTQLIDSRAFNCKESYVKKCLRYFGRDGDSVMSVSSDSEPS